MKKGQVEIIGLVVIVLLLFFGLLFYVQLSSKEGSDFIREAEENLEVSNMLSAIRLYTACDDTQLQDVIKACAEKSFVCGEDACEIVQREVPNLIQMYGWEEDKYMFHIEEELYSPKTCTGNTFVDNYMTAGKTVKLTYCY